MKHSRKQRRDNSEEHPGIFALAFFPYVRGFILVYRLTKQSALTSGSNIRPWFGAIISVFGRRGGSQIRPAFSLRSRHSLQLGVFTLRLLQNRNPGVRIFPQRKKILISRPRFARIACD
jgi:hypothetical protein